MTTSAQKNIEHNEIMEKQKAGRASTRRFGVWGTPPQHSWGLTGLTAPTFREVKIFRSPKNFETTQG